MAKRKFVHPSASPEGVKQLMEFAREGRSGREIKLRNRRVAVVHMAEDYYIILCKTLVKGNVFIHAVALSKETIFAMANLVASLELDKNEETE